NASLILVFIGYALVQNINVLYVLYCMDSFLYMFVVAQTTYLNKIAPPEDIRPALSMGVTMNHIAAVIVPLVGGLIWNALDRYDVIFYGGSVVALVSFIVSQFLWSDKDYK
ncbi:MAG: MFS transporter, partial [Candidatus Poribacteria bacterium]